MWDRAMAVRTDQKAEGVGPRETSGGKIDRRDFFKEIRLKTGGRGRGYEEKEEEGDEHRGDEALG